MNTAIICIDLIYEILHPEGKLAAKGYPSFAASHNCIAKIAERQARMRMDSKPVIHVQLAFASDYADHPKASKLLGGARAAGILRQESPSTSFIEQIGPIGGDIVIQKKRISAFFQTPLELTLRSLGVSDIILCGVATDLAIQSAARDAHDRDFSVHIAADACIAATDEDHDSALRNMAKFANIL